MASRAEVFGLEPFNFDSLDRSCLATLPPITPRFVLPRLDDVAGSPDRLLAGLRGRYKAKVSDDGVQSVKGKEKEVDAGPVLAEAVGEGIEEDFWLNVMDREPGPSKPRWVKPKVWDNLRDPVDTAQDPMLMSEDSIFALEALISTQVQTLSEFCGQADGTRDTTHSKLPHLESASQGPPRSSREILKLVMQATLGNVTTGGVKWNPKEYRFVWASNGGRATGLEQSTIQSAIQDFLEIATCLRRLELTVDSLTPRPMTPTHHSLLYALLTCLTYVKQRLTSSIEGNSRGSQADWNRSASGNKDLRALLGVLCEIIQWPLDQIKPTPLPSRATAVLTHLHAHLLARLSTSSPSQSRSEQVLALAYLLKTASQPLLALLHQWVGLADQSPADEVIDPDAQPWSDLGITRIPMPMPVSPNREPRWEYTFSSSKMPGFIPKADRRTLFEAGRSLRLLREASGGRHPLCAGGWELAGSWAWGEEQEDITRLRLHSKRVEREIEHWQKSSRGLPKSISTSSSISRLRQPRKYRKSLPVEFMPPKKPHVLEEVPHVDVTATKSSKGKAFDDIWSLVHQVPGTHLSSQSAPSLWSPSPISGFEELLQWHADPHRPLLPEDTPTLSQHITSHLLAPLLTHSQLVSSALVSLYLDNLNFLDHLDILQAYWLGGDVSFLERVNGALFGKDSAGAGEALGMGKRARTRARLGLGRDDDDHERAEEQGEWGIGLGIGLSERTKWPPGGAELTYALRTAIVDDEQEAVTKGGVWEGIEDKVSYAIQDLPEDQRDGRRSKWLNPQAIEALDFLYLAYSPPPTIAVLLPHNLMQKYQTIHNLLLRLGRVETVLRSMFIDIHHQYDVFDEPVKSGVDAHTRRHQRVGGRRQTRERFGIFPVGSREEKRLWQLRYRMSHFITTFSRYILDIGIEGNWKVLRKRLKKLQKRSSATPTTSRPGTPPSARGDNDENEDYFEFNDLGLDLEEDDLESTQQLHQLHSIHSLVLYHHLIMDRIMRSCLLHPSAGHQVTLKILMTLFGIVLDFAKTVKEVEKGLLGWQDGAEKIEDYWREWVEKETVFLIAVERLSQRTPASHSQGTDDKATEDDHDLEMLLQGERDGGDGNEREGLVLGRQGADLQELVLRIRLSA